MISLGYVPAGSTIRLPWDTRNSVGASVTVGGFVAADIEVYKDGSTTQRASDNGYTATTDFDAATGCHLAVIDLSDDSDAGFYAAGSEYLVMINAVTVEGQTVRFWLARFLLGPAPVNVSEINASAAAAIRLALSAGTMIPGTVDTTAFAPTTAEFEADDITEATGDHYNNRYVFFTSGALVGQFAPITDYALSGGRGHFTVTAMTEAPGNNDTFIII